MRNFGGKGLDYIKEVRQWNIYWEISVSLFKDVKLSNILGLFHKILNH